ncbi:MAG: FecR family protein [Bacteroidales bacterium]|nr:FecR family protein [Bacteroidales bacterium]
MDQEILDIITRVLSGEAGLEDKQRLINWLGDGKSNIKEFGQIESLWNAVDILASKKKFNSEEAYNRFEKLVNKKSSIPEPNRARKIKMDWVLRIAAILVIAFGLSYILLLSHQNSLQHDKSVCEVVAPRGSQAHLILPDGTKVWLNADSKINYSTDFNRKTRDIYLEGEGYFEIAKNPAKPFIVNTSDIRVKALGTTFNIRSYPGENTIEATLIEGKVELEKILSKVKGEKLLTLKPNQKATYFINNEKIANEKIVSEASESKKEDQAVPVTPGNNKTKIILDEEVNTEMSTAWKNNKLCFDNESFQDLAVMLERRFDVNIYFADENVKQYHFSGTFGNIIIEQVLSAMQYASPFHYLINESDIYISDTPLKDSSYIELQKNKKINTDQENKFLN